MTAAGGVIGVLLVVAIVLAAVAALYERSRQTCPECTSRIPKDATRCRHCGAEV